MTARVVVYSREGCHLCAVAEKTVADVCGELEETWERVDIDTDPALVERFTNEAPVTFVDGAQHDFWRVDPDRLRAALLDGRQGAQRPRRGESPGGW